MTNSLSRSSFESAFAGTRLDRSLFDADPALDGLRVEPSPPRRDVAIDTDGERERLFDALDRLDGRRDATITLVDATGTVTAAAEPARALAEAAGRGALQAQIADALRHAGLDPRVVHLGMQDTSAPAEVAALRRHAPVVAIADVDGSSFAMVAGRRFELDSHAERVAFARSLGLGEGATRTVVAELDRTDPGGRRELAELAHVWARAEHGERIPPRLMLSGHGNGTEIFGHQDDAILDASVVSLAHAMPRAARQIEHLHLAACQHGWEARMAPFLEAFPRLESVWGYTGFSPSGAAAIGHQRQWERATHDGDAHDLRREDAAGTRRADEIAVWTRERGFEGLHGRELAVIDAELRELGPTIEASFAGERVDGRRLTRAYEVLQEARNNPDFDEQSATYRHQIESLTATTLRLRLYDHAASAFMRDHASEIRRGYESVGLPCPDLAHQSRAETLRSIELLATRAHTAPARAALQLLQRGLRDLDPVLIPVSYL